MNNLFSGSATNFFNDFGYGKSVPGSGCGCAALSMLSAKMIRTHVKLTLSQSSGTINKNEYKKFIKEIDYEFSGLMADFHEDYNFFEKYRLELNKAKSEKDFNKVYKLERECDLILEEATEVLLKIARASLRLAELAIIVFDNGYEAAKGESGLPMITLLGVANGCILIAYQNLGELTMNTSVKLILEELDYLDTESERLKSKVEIRKIDIKRIKKTKLRINSLIAQTKSNISTKYQEIERVSREVQKIVWEEYVSSLSKTENPKSPLEVFDPEIILNLIGY